MCSQLNRRENNIKLRTFLIESSAYRVKHALIMEIGRTDVVFTQS